MDKLTSEGRFKRCVHQILEHEGGLSKNKRDPGGVTQWGISLRFLKAAGIDVNGDGAVDADDIIALTKPGAIDIYRKYWWDRYKYDAINELVVIEKVFDLAVNMGGRSAHKLFQIAINRLRDKPIAVDGIIGAQTIGAANKLNGGYLRQELRDCAEHRYIEILANNPALEVFRNGWLRRAAW